MPRTKRLTAYPEVFTQIAERIAVGNEEFKIPLDSWKEASSYAGKFHAWQAAIRREIQIHSDKSQFPLTTLKDLQAWSDKVVVEFKMQEQFDGFVYFRPRDKTPMARALEQAIAEGGQVVGDRLVESGAEAAMASLTEKLKREGGAG